MRRHEALIACVLLLGLPGSSGSSGSIKSISDYRFFRALSIDLLGRAPTLSELAKFEQPDFDLDKWLDARLTGPAYVDRVGRIYADLLQLELPATYRFEPGMTTLYTAELASVGGPVQVYYRSGQRRVDANTDGGLCFTTDETGLTIPEPGRRGVGTPKPIDNQLLAERTVEIKPWWLYADYRAPYPKQRLGPGQVAGFEPMWQMFVEHDGTPTKSIRICKEEAQLGDKGRVFATGRKTRADVPAVGHRGPLDSAFATSHVGQPVSCLTTLGFKSSNECGCGVGLERCLPANPMAFPTPTQAPLGAADPFVANARPTWMWLVHWWSEEANHFVDRIFSEDRDVRELLTSRATTINGPLGQFYRFFAGATCCGNFGPDLGFTDPEPLFDPRAVPPTLEPQQIDTWITVPDRGAHSAGLMTMPVFLIKYGTRRARAHVVYSAFLCKDFTAEPTTTLAASNEPDLSVREGCSDCHSTLEPLASYFTRIQESDWTYLPEKQFPLSLARCATPDAKRIRPECKAYYDPAFTDAKGTILRGGIGDRDNVDKGPNGFALEITGSPAFAPCVVKNVAQSFLGRQLTSTDEKWQAELSAQFVAGGYRMRSLVGAIVRSAQYHEATSP